MLPWLLAAAATFVAVIAAVAFVAARARARGLAAEVQKGIEPYLRRKAAEAGLVGAATTWTSRATAEQIVGHSARVARQLLEIERLGPVPTTTRELEVAQTQPITDGDFVITDRQRK
jgi:hypothetical protein